MPTNPRNPFHELGLRVDATNAQIVERAEELVQTCRDEQERDRIIRAKEELITHPLTRAKHERTEPARTDYAMHERWADFVHDHRHAPIPRGGLTEGAALSAADIELPAALRALTRWAVDAELEDVLPLLRALPTVEFGGTTPVEVRDVLFG
ncbi:hypothetical protein [Streptomyces noursei]|uniref:hypothetical protein n=1 Tax=Streptomyces noursei TaxID=1971 RepID=UPI0037FEFA63